jgi:hypothetical protein
MLRALPDPGSMPGGFTSGALAVTLPPPRPKWLVRLASAGLLVGLGVLGTVLWVSRQPPSRAPILVRARDALPPHPAQDPLAKHQQRTGARESPTAAGTVRLHLEVDPAEAEVLLEGKVIGTGLLDLTLPRNERPLSLLVQAPGFNSSPLTFVPDHDERLSVALVPEDKGSKNETPPAHPATPRESARPRRFGEIRDNPYLEPERKK